MRTIEAVYEAGIFRPVEPLSLPEGLRAEVIIPVSADHAAGEAEEARPTETPYEIMMRIAALYDEDADPYVGWTHDEILYGRDGKGAR